MTTKRSLSLLTTVQKYDIAEVYLTLVAAPMTSTTPMRWRSVLPVKKL